MMLSTRVGAGRCIRGLRTACPLVRTSLPRRAFADDVPGMSSGNCITEATTRSLIKAVGPGGGGGGGDGGSGGGGGGGSGGSGGSDAGGAGDSNTPHPLRNVTFAFAAFLAVGSVFAFVKKGSTKSLGAGGGAALILGLCARSMVGAAAAGPARVAFALCTLLGIAMASRFNNTKKFFPAGLVALSSLGLATAFVGVGL
ncbi:hypothetical protein HXX76_014600 [Chlamydomonas incerta]|uniref:Uncharacterized protein n=1 Tax=Chlamydomonas incerta TaxID=51695 RepID=A0A835VT51_CHLIN|nr:hypothetical protein HXX76_014600 [Chlamydomonas incerta]|eukprot:KAG2424391.1 hypothetical protein HXX76_014600 [Chlamydomonas incerta]